MGILITHEKKNKQPPLAPTIIFSVEQQVITRDCYSCFNVNMMANTQFSNSLFLDRIPYSPPFLTVKLISINFFKLPVRIINNLIRPWMVSVVRSERGNLKMFIKIRLPDDFERIELVYVGKTQKENFQAVFGFDIPLRPR